jgi:hypothetical protein
MRKVVGVVLLPVLVAAATLAADEPNEKAQWPA